MAHSDYNEEFQALFDQANEASDRGDQAKAVDLCARMLSFVEEEYGPNHPVVVGGLSMLGAAYGRQGDYVRVEQVFQRAVALAENLPGPDHPDVAIMIDGLAQAYQFQGRYAEAEPLFER